jgi:hypothetical protein
MKYSYESARTDCKFYDAEKRQCKGLNKLYCAIDEKPCSFHKKKEDEDDQTRTNAAKGD